MGGVGCFKGVNQKNQIAMKKIFNAAIYAVLLAGALAFTACQEEFEEINTSDAQEESFQATSSTAQLMEKTAFRDGSFDNIVDGSSCFALNFPYTVNVNGLDITVDSKEDLRLIEEIFDEFDDDEDVLEILFRLPSPWQIILRLPSTTKKN